MPKKMSSATASIRLPWYLAILIFIAMHNDLWLWDTNRLFMGLPIGLSYHILYCAAATLVLYLLIRVFPNNTRPAESENDAEGSR